MSEPAPSAEPAATHARTPWDWRLLCFLARRLPNQPVPPPRAAIRFGLILGILEGTFVGVFHGGIASLIISPIWGALVGVICGIFGGKLLQYARSLTLSLLISFAIGAIGAGLIAFYVPMFVWFASRVPFWAFAGLALLVVLLCIPLCVLLPLLLYREVRAALAGMAVGASVGAVGLPIVGVLIAFEHPDLWWAVPLGVLLGVIGGLVDGAIAGTLVGALIGALVNANRRTFLPTYGGFAGAIGLGVAGWFIGGGIAGEAGKAIGVMLGVSWGAVAGLTLGALLTPRSWKTRSLKDDADPLSPAVFDISDGRRLADFANTPGRMLLVILLLAQIAFRKQKLCLEPDGDEYRVIFDACGLDLDPHPPQGLRTVRDFIITLKELARLGPSDGDGSPSCREGDLQVIVSSYRVDLHMAFEPTPGGERVTLTTPKDDSASEAATVVARRFTFVLRAREWFFPRGWPKLRFLREMA